MKFSTFIAPLISIPLVFASPNPNNDHY
ncbi:hypothetical protein FANTH_11136, partial [Fusarium anthophilum]